MRVLVVDDDPDIVSVVRLLLKVNGMTALEAHCGTDALDIAVAERPDLILLDIMMPDIDGFEVMHELRLDFRTRHIPVIFMTAKADGEYKQKAMGMGANGYVTKPYERNELMRQIRMAAVKGVPQ